MTKIDLLTHSAIASLFVFGTMASGKALAAKAGSDKEEWPEGTCKKIVGATLKTADKGKK